jgi:hypothetical protein
VVLRFNRLSDLNLRQVTGLGAASLLALSVAACSSSHDSEEVRKPVHPVKGTVLVQGKPAVGAFVLFIPTNEPPNTPDPRPRAEVGADGSFIVTTYDENDGAPVGEYTVAINWPGGVLPDGREEPEDKLLGRYDVTNSKLKASVKEGQNDLPPFNL